MIAMRETPASPQYPEALGGIPGDYLPVGLVFFPIADGNRYIDGLAIVILYVQLVESHFWQWERCWQLDVYEFHGNRKFSFLCLCRFLLFMTCFGR